MTVIKISIFAISTLSFLVGISLAVLILTSPVESSDSSESLKKFDHSIENQTVQETGKRI